MRGLRQSMPCLHNTFTSYTLRIGPCQSGLSRRDRAERKTIPLILVQAVPRREVHASLAALLGLRPLTMGTQNGYKSRGRLVEQVASDVSVLQQQQIHLQRSSVIRLLRRAWAEQVTGDLHLF